MDSFESELHDDSSSFDEILDFEFNHEIQELDDSWNMVDEDPYYRSLDDY